MIDHDEVDELWTEHNKSSDIDNGLEYITESNYCNSCPSDIRGLC